MARRVLFLDIDGVLNRDGTKARCNGFVGVDRDLSDKLLKWLKDKDIAIVLSSTWRRHADMHDHLHDAGIHWIDVTPTVGSRGMDIQAWLNKNQDVIHYIILDDDADMLPNQLTCFVQTDNALGLQDHNIDHLDTIHRRFL